MSQLARVSDGLHRFQRDAKALDDTLRDLAAREVAALRRHFEQQAAEGGPGAAGARRKAAIVAEAERHLRDSRAHLQVGAGQAWSWLVEHGAAGDHGGAGGDPEPPQLSETRAGGDPSGEIYALVHRANRERAARESTDATMEALERLMGQLAERDGVRSELVGAWQGERDGGRNAYEQRLRDPAPDTTYVVSGAADHLFQFETDGRGNTIRARTTLTDLDQPRAPGLQTAAKRRKGGSSDDDGGHLIARSFGGPAEEVNIVPQDWFQNQRGEWRKLEREWRSLLEAGCEVEVEIEPRHADGAPRPTALVVRWSFRARGAPAPFEWVKDVVTISNDHDAGPRRGPGRRPRGAG